MNKKLLHLFCALLFVIGPSSAFAIYALASKFPQFVRFAGLFFDILGGGLLLLGARFQPDFQYYTPLLVWNGTPRQIIRRRLIWGAAGLIWMLIPMAFFVLILSYSRPFWELMWEWWWLWTLGMPLLVFAGALIADLSMRDRLKDAPTVPTDAHPNPARIRYLFGYFLFMLLLQALIQIGGRRVGISTVALISCFALGVVCLLSALFYRRLEHWWILVPDPRPPESLVQRQRWLMFIGAGLFPTVGIAMLTGLIPPEYWMHGFLIPVGVFLLFLIVDSGVWRARVLRDKWKASE